MSKNNKNSFLGIYLSNRRKAMGLTQEEMACKMNVSKSAIAKWETNGGIPDRDNLKSIADVIGVNVDFLHEIIKGKFIKNTISSDAERMVDEFIKTFEKYGYSISKDNRNQNSKELKEENTND